jgi:hypothetical protein
LRSLRRKQGLPPTMPLRLMKAEKADIPQLVTVYFDTFVKSPLVLTLKPNVPSTRTWFEKSMKSDMEKPHVRIYKVVDDEASDEIAAFAKWTAPHAETEDNNTINYPVDGDVALFEKVLGMVTEKKKKILGNEDNWRKFIFGFEHDDQISV